MADERIYTIPLRKEFQKAPIYQRTKKAIKATRAFLIKHLKTENVRIGRYLNEKLTERGMKHPPAFVKVRVWSQKTKRKDKDIELLWADLVDAPKEQPAPEKETKAGKPEAKKSSVEQKPLSEMKMQAQTPATSVAAEPLAEEKKEVLEHQQEKKFTGERNITTDKPEGQREAAMEKVERAKKSFPKSQKPGHEKKK